MGVMRRLVLLAIVGLSASRASGDVTLGSREGWKLSRTDQLCGMSMTYNRPGQTDITFAKSVKGWLVIQVIDRSWTTTAGAPYQIQYQINGRVLYGERSVGAADGVKKGYLTKLRPDFEQALAAGHTLRLYIGDQLVDDLSLTGTAAAINAVNQCLEGLRANRTATVIGKAPLVPRPTAPLGPKTTTPLAGAARTGSVHAPTPIGSASAWIMGSDYPSRALRDEREGTTSYILTIAPDGKVIGCQVTRSSGHADLDAATCDNVRRRARLTPATDASGRPTSGSYSNKVRWSISKR
jgi:periplasmic protein TonB